MKLKKGNLNEPNFFFYFAIMFHVRKYFLYTYNNNNIAVRYLKFNVVIVIESLILLLLLLILMFLLIFTDFYSIYLIFIDNFYGC